VFDVSPVTKKNALVSFSDICTSTQKRELEKHKPRCEHEAKLALIKLANYQSEQRKKLANMRKQKIWQDADPMSSFAEEERLEFLKIFQQNLSATKN